jgi:hypothetical protein
VKNGISPAIADFCSMKKRLLYSSRSRLKHSERHRASTLLSLSDIGKKENRIGRNLSEGAAIPFAERGRHAVEARDGGKAVERHRSIGNLALFWRKVNKKIKITPGK